MRTTQGAEPAGTADTGDPYAPASDYLEWALSAADTAAAEERSGHRWQDAIFALGIAQMSLPVSMNPVAGGRLPCLELAQASCDALEAIPPDRRALDHLLTLAYVHDARRAIEAALADTQPE